MRRATSISVVTLLFSVALIAGCGGSKAPAETPSEAAADSSDAPASPPTDENSSARPTLTAEACEAGGGTVVGDIGDGAIHRPEYRCPNGAAPSGTIGAPEGGPVAIEGSVCCAR